MGTDSQPFGGYERNQFSVAVMMPDAHIWISPLTKELLSMHGINAIVSRTRLLLSISLTIPQEATHRSHNLIDWRDSQTCNGDRPSPLQARCLTHPPLHSYHLLVVVTGAVSWT